MNNAQRFAVVSGTIAVMFAVFLCAILTIGFFIQQAVQCGERGGAYIWNSAACVQGVTK